MWRCFGGIWTPDVRVSKILVTDLLVFSSRPQADQ